jgi:energy-coupling factor transporter ATP-binding protein EcfA2
MSNTFKKIEIRDWRQFQQVEIDFHPRLTVLTGANGAGKTTLLNLLGRHFGWDVALIATSQPTKKGVFRYFSGIGKSWKRSNDIDTNNPQHLIGTISYTETADATIGVNEEVSESFNVNINNQQAVEGVFLPSHRPVYSYRKVTQIPATLDTSEQLFSQFYSNLRGMYQSESRYDPPSFRLKSSLISLAVFGYGNKAVDPSPEAIATFEGFERILKKVLPIRLGFQRLVIRMPEVVLACDSGEFSLDAASGGVAALIDIAWQLYMKSLVTPEFVAVIDEPENHLHPEMQRAIMPCLLEAFPKLQFIVATHNPFVVTSVEDSNVIVLNYLDNRVVSSRIDEVDRSASANQVLTDVLGLPAPIPLWVQHRLDDVISQFSDKELTTEVLADLRTKMNDAGLGRMFPEVIDRLVEEPRG